MWDFFTPEKGQRSRWEQLCARGICTAKERDRAVLRLSVAPSALPTTTVASF